MNRFQTYVWRSLVERPALLAVISMMAGAALFGSLLWLLSVLAPPPPQLTLTNWPSFGVGRALVGAGHQVSCNYSARDQPAPALSFELEPSPFDGVCGLTSAKELTTAPCAASAP
jgi:hypothetical protein